MFFQTLEFHEKDVYDTWLRWYIILKVNINNNIIILIASVTFTIYM